MGKIIDLRPLKQQLGEALAEHSKWMDEMTRWVNVDQSKAAAAANKALEADQLIQHIQSLLDEQRANAQPDDLVLE